MKKLNIFLAVAVMAAFTFTSCNNNGKAKLPVLKTQMDSLNYAFGLANGDGIKNYYLKGDSTKKAIESLMAGFNEGIKGKVEKETSELTDLGTKIGSSLKDQKKSGLMGDSTLKVDIDLIKQGLINGLRGSKIQMTPQEAQAYLQASMQKLQAKKQELEAKKLEKVYGANKAAGEKFLAENGKKAGVVTTASGLQYQVVKKGTGPVPTDNDKVKVDYHGTLIDGTVFDSSVDRKQPAVFPVTGVIKGWTEVLKLMPVGSKYKVFVPQELAYGSQERGAIKPFSMLIFDVQLISIEKETAAPQMSPEQMKQMQQQMQQQKR